jgi:hypothetical protein
MCITILFLRKHRFRAEMLTTLAQPQSVKVDALGLVREETEEQNK